MPDFPKRSYIIKQKQKASATNNICLKSRLDMMSNTFCEKLFFYFYQGYYWFKYTYFF